MYMNALEGQRRDALQDKEWGTVKHNIARIHKVIIRVKYLILVSFRIYK